MHMDRTDTAASTPLPTDCIGRCNPTGQYVLHPITLNYVTDRMRPFCTIPPVYDRSRPGNYATVGPCTMASNATISDKTATQDIYSVPQLGVSRVRFLAMYQIYSYEDSSTWYRISTANGKELLWATLKRVFNAVFVEYGVDKLSHIDDESTDTLRSILITYWLPRWSRRFHMNYDAITRMFTTDKLRHIVMAYYDAAKDSWSSIVSPMDLLKSTCTRYVEEEESSMTKRS